MHASCGCCRSTGGSAFVKSHCWTALGGSSPPTTWPADGKLGSFLVSSGLLSFLFTSPSISFSYSYVRYSKIACVTPGNEGLRGYTSPESQANCQRATNKQCLTAFDGAQLLTTCPKQGQIEVRQISFSPADLVQSGVVHVSLTGLSKRCLIQGNEMPSSSYYSPVICPPRGSWERCSSTPTTRFVAARPPL
jgi:hypothetical protein